jgi:hypothetical protein
VGDENGTAKASGNQARDLWASPVWGWARAALEITGWRSANTAAALL